MQLGDVDVPADVLNARGQRLEDVLRTSNTPSIDDLLGPPPTEGWRLISGDLGSPVERQPRLAAPWADPRGNGWMVIKLWRFDGEWQAAIAGDTRPLRPSRARRRVGLELRWSSPTGDLVLPARTPPGQLTVLLRNTGHAPWANHGEDNNSTRILVTDERGEMVQPFPRSGIDPGMVAFPVQRLPRVEPEGDVALVAHFDAQIARHGLPPGRFTIQAHLLSLGLRTEPRHVVVKP